jgi:acetyltransferase-like isoleucine patch superfamily enzyme
MTRVVPALVHGPGTIIDDDVRMGSGVSDPSSGGIRIGDRARIRSGSEISDGVRIGDRFDAGHGVSVGERTLIGDDCRISSHASIGADCTIGDRVIVDASCYVARFTTIEDDVMLAPGVCLASDPHPGTVGHLCMRGPTIKRGAQIGMNATILPFVTIGERSLVGAGSVVTHDVPDGIVVVGNPARFLKPVGRITCPLDLEEGQYLRQTAATPPPSRG